MKLPPLLALRAFEALSRTNSVKNAADELSVTPAAVSQHVKSLEEWLGVALTERDGRGVSLTAVGAQFANDVQPAFRRIADAAEYLRTAPNLVRLTSVTSFSAKWLAPRLGLFMAQHPGVDLRMTAADQLIDLRRAPYDIAIRESHALPEDIAGDVLYEAIVRPYASPAYAASRKQGRNFNWNGAQLVHGEGMHDFWPAWFAQNGVVAKGLKRASSASHYLLMLEAAKTGQGIALLPDYVVEAESKRKELVCVDTRGLDTGWRVWLCWPDESLRRMQPATRAFRDWVLSQVIQPATK
jgi:LysR family transcriptional regulator, glycine cleavage system transcriptional activator